jgi:predicted CoA-binding protein
MAKTIIIGASMNPQRYSYIAARLLIQNDEDVVLIGNKEGEILNHPIIKEIPSIEKTDSILLYLRPEHQKKYYNFILDSKPDRVIMNPGAENAELMALCQENNIQVICACAIAISRANQQFKP